MTLVLDDTLGGPSANTYVTLAAADAYLDARFDTSQWDGLSEDDKTRALLMATQRLQLENFQGWPVSYTQALAWPRAGTVTRDGVPLSTTAIPQLVCDAQCELALVLAKNPESFADSDLGEFTNLQLGTLNVTPRTRRDIPLPTLVGRMLAPVLEGSYSLHVERG